MRLPVRRKRAGFLLIYLGLGLLFLLKWFDIPMEYQLNYCVLLMAYFIVGGVTFYFYASGKVKIFDPFSIISMLYLMIMVIYPLYDYIRMNLAKSGVDTSAGCIKATLIFMPAYCLFCLGYFRKQTKRDESNFFRNIETLANKDMALIGIICWIVSFVGCMAGQASRGFSIQYILSMGRVAQQNEVFINSSSGGLLFLLMLAPTMIVSQMMILVYSKNCVLKLCTMVLSFIYLFMRGSRMLVLVMIAAPLVYWYIKRNRSPSMHLMTCAGITALILFAILQIARVSIARGQDFRTIVNEHLFSLDTYLAVFESDFSTYKVFYGIVQAIPQRKEYLMGEGLFGYTLALIIPRVLWPGKPDAPERAVVYAAMGQRAVDAGNAYPNLGTFYSEFGIIGCLIFMWIYGALASKSKKLMASSMKSQMILYACLWPFFFQLTARSISNAFYSLFFGMLPMIAAWFYSKVTQKSRCRR